MNLSAKFTSDQVNIIKQSLWVGRVMIWKQQWVIKQLAVLATVLAKKYSWILVVLICQPKAPQFSR